MLTIPAIDLIDNNAVRLSKGDFKSLKSYSENPIELVEQFVDAGFDRIHIVDLEASKLGKFTSLELIKKIKSKFDVKIEFGGGIRSYKDIKTLNQLEVDYFILGSITVKNENEVKEFISKYDKDKFIFAADVLNNEIKISGWTESSNISLNEYISKWSKEGIQNFLCTDISKDGMLQGPNFDLYKSVMNTFPNIELIASGGISGINDLYELEKKNLKYAVVGKAFYEGKISLEELSRFAK